MNISHTAATSKPKIGTCPHGLPAGACPICSGIGGGGGASAKKADRPVGEMSWDQCYTAWQQILKTKELAQQKRNDALHAQLHAPIDFGSKLGIFAQKLASLADKLIDFTQKTNSKYLPNLIEKPIILATKIFVGVLNVLENVSILAQKTINLVQQKLADISDKLNAIFGELKNSIEKKISDKLKAFRKKFKSIFQIQEPAELDDEEKKIEENKRLFEFKTVLDNLKRKLKRN